MFPTTDIQKMPTRRLTKQFANKAIGTSAPNTLHTNKPTEADAMGFTPKSGILSFMHDGASQDITLHIWHAKRNKLDPSKGWVKVAESAALSTKTVDPEAIASIKVMPNVPFFLQAGTSAITNAWVTGPEHDMNPNTDNTTDA